MGFYYHIKPQSISNTLNQSHKTRLPINKTRGLSKMVYVIPFRQERFYNEDDGDLVHLTYYPTKVSDDQLLNDHPYIKYNFTGFKPKSCGIKYRKGWKLVYYVEHVGK